MSKKRKRKAGLLAAAACLATALMATPVSAALSDAEKEERSNVQGVWFEYP